jgi:hypothetical protein
MMAGLIAREKGAQKRNIRCEATLPIYPARDVAMQKDPKIPSFRDLMIHFGNGAFLGALLAFALIFTERNTLQVIANSSSPATSAAVFIGTISFAIGLGATLSGYILTAIELTALEAKQRNDRFKRRGDSGF